MKRIGLCAGLSLLFVWMVSGNLLSSLFENDLWWMVPMVSHHVEGRSLWEILHFLLSPAPKVLGQPILKLYLFLWSSWVGLYTLHLILISIGFHFANAWLLYRVNQQLGLNPTASLFSALVYLTLFAHFHAILWPTAVQHTIAVFTILSVLSLYLKTEGQVHTNPHGYRRALFLTFAMGILASLQRSALIAPVLILTHILVGSKDSLERQARYDRWLPLFLAFSIYPVISLALVGDVIINDAFVKAPLPAFMKMILLFGGVWVFLLLIRRSLRVSFQGPYLRKGVLALGGVTLLVLFGFLCLRDHRQLLLPYNALVPLNAILVSFLEPIRTALLIDSTEAYHLIPPQVSFYSLCLSMFLIGAFIFAFVRRNRSLILWLVWYALSLVHLLHQYSSFPLVTPSRYFIYLSPVFAVLLGSVLVGGGAFLFKRIRASPLLEQALLAGLLIGLCVPNLMAIRLEMFRGKLANTFFLYDDIRTAHLIKNDLQRSAADLHRISPSRVCVNNVVQMPFRDLGKEFLCVDPSQYDDFRAVVSEVFHDKSMRQIRVNEPALDREGTLVYILQGGRITDAQGRAIEAFDQLFEEGVFQMRVGHPRQALDLFGQAIETRPFLIRYVLSSYRLEDLRWVTHGLEMREWVQRIGEGYNSWSGTPVSKEEHILSIIHQELSDYILCFFFTSYLKHQLGDLKGSREALSNIWFLERNPQALISWISPLPYVKANPSLGAFVKNLKDSEIFHDPIPWRKEDYGFGRFLVRFLFHRDIRSGWDRSRVTLT